MQREEYKIKIRRVGERRELFDQIRGRWVVVTPEEHVRQIFIKHLICKLSYPATHIAVESHFRFANGRSQRCDIIVYDSVLRPFMVVECKAQSVKIDSSVASQATRYNAEIGARYIALTNLDRTLCFSCEDGGQYRPHAALPSWE